MKPMLTQTYFVRRINSSKNPFELFLNVTRYCAFIQSKIHQSFNFGDPLLVTKSL